MVFWQQINFDRTLTGGGCDRKVTGGLKCNRTLTGVSILRELWQRLVVIEKSQVRQYEGIYTTIVAMLLCNQLSQRPHFSSSNSVITLIPDYPRLFSSSGGSTQAHPVQCCHQWCAVSNFILHFPSTFHRLPCPAPACNMVLDKTLLWKKHRNQLKQRSLVQKIMRKFVGISNKHLENSIKIILLTRSFEYKSHLRFEDGNFEIFIPLEYKSQYTVKLKKYNYIQRIHRTYKKYTS